MLKGSKQHGHLFLMSSGRYDGEKIFLQQRLLAVTADCGRQLQDVNNES